MDNKKDCKIPYCGNLPGKSGAHVIVGAKQLRKAMRAGTVKQVFLAANADPDLTSPLADACAREGIGVCWVRSMAELGRACGIEVGAAAAAEISD